MAGAGWIRFEAYEGRLDPQYAGKYRSPGIRYPLIERTRRWDIVRVDGEPVGGVYRSGQYTVLSRGHDMMEKAHEEAAAYRLHFKRCPGVGICQDIGHPGGPKRSMAQAMNPLSPARALDTKEEDTSEHSGSSERENAVALQGDWVRALDPVREPRRKSLSAGAELVVVPLEFELWDGPRLTMAEDCNKRGGRVVGDRGELSCAEVEIVKRLRASGWQAAWIQSFKCGRLTWGDYIADARDLPDAVRAIQAVAGSAGGHPDVLAWKDDRVVAIESKGPGDALKPSRIEWFGRALGAGVGVGDIGVVEWRPASTPVPHASRRATRGLLQERLNEAMAYALELHGTQVRKATSIPYISHLLSVCALVLEDGGTEDEAIAALLHDGPEDQGGQATLDEIRRRFGPEVAAMVVGLSDTLEDRKPPWRERKETYLDQLRREPESVLRISLADKLHNIRSIAVDHALFGDELWARFNAGVDAQAWYYRTLLEIFEVRLPGSRNLPEFRRLVREVFDD